MSLVRRSVIFAPTIGVLARRASLGPGGPGLADNLAFPLQHTIGHTSEARACSRMVPKSFFLNFLNPIWRDVFRLPSPWRSASDQWHKIGPYKNQKAGFSDSKRHCRMILKAGNFECIFIFNKLRRVNNRTSSMKSISASYDPVSCGAQRCGSAHSNRVIG